MDWARTYLVLPKEQRPLTTLRVFFFLIKKRKKIVLHFDNQCFENQIGRLDPVLLGVLMDRILWAGLGRLVLVLGASPGSNPFARFIYGTNLD